MFNVFGSFLEAESNWMSCIDLSLVYIILLSGKISLLNNKHVSVSGSFRKYTAIGINGGKADKNWLGQVCANGRLYPIKKDEYHRIACHDHTKTKADKSFIRTETPELACQEFRARAGSDDRHLQQEVSWQTHQQRSSVECSQWKWLGCWSKLYSRQQPCRTCGQPHLFNLAVPVSYKSACIADTSQSRYIAESGAQSSR